MAHREFTDAAGVRWQVWEVIPTTAERRSANERRVGARDSHTRRTRHELRVRMDETLTNGWLVFESAAEKRRLRPVPPTWNASTDEQLAAFCRAAEVARATRRLVE